MLYSLDARRDRLLTNSPYTQTSGAELPILVGSLHEGSSVRLTQPSIGEVPLQRSSPAGWSRAGPLCKSHRAISESPVTPRVESTKPHSLSHPPHCEITSACLPRHPVVAYRSHFCKMAGCTHLCLVGHNGSGHVSHSHIRKLRIWEVHPGGSPCARSRA